MMIDVIPVVRTTPEKNPNLIAPTLTSSSSMCVYSSIKTVKGRVKVKPIPIVMIPITTNHLNPLAVFAVNKIIFHT